jgi:hypothetical protein
MPSSRLAIAFSFALAFAPTLGSAQEQSVEPISPERIRAAIAAGTAKREVKPMRVGLPASLRRGAIVIQNGTAYTPELRIAMASRAAAASYKTFSEADVTPQLAGDYVLLVLPPISSPTGVAMSKVDLETVLLLPRRSKDPAQAIRPLWTRTDVSTMQNAFGAQWEAQTVLAAFPNDVLDPEMEIVSVYRSEVSFGGGPQKRELRAIIFDKPEK